MSDLTDALDADQAQLWHEYLLAEAQGVRSQTLSALAAFVTALQADSQERRDTFAETFCRLTADDGVIITPREPLFAGVIGPYLVSAYQDGNSNTARWITHYFRFFTIPSARHLLAGINSYPMKLLEEAFRRNPDDALTQDALIQEFAYHFDYAVHEVPSGVLNGNTGSTVEECQEWQNDLALFQEVVERRGLNEKYGVATHYWGFHFHGYADYLTHREQYRSYADYVETHWQE